MDRQKIAAKLIECARLLAEPVARGPKTANEHRERVATSIPSISKWVDEWDTDDYPYGRLRTSARWYVEGSKGKKRIGRVTVNPKTGRPNKPKKTTYAAAAKIGIAGDRCYLFLGRPGQIGVYDGTMKYLMTFFTKDSEYRKYAKALGFKTKGRAEVKMVPGGAVIDGLQGTSMKLSEILELGGIDMSTDRDNIKSVKPQDKFYEVRWIVQFKDGRPDYIITVLT